MWSPQAWGCSVYRPPSAARRGCSRRRPTARPSSPADERAHKSERSEASRTIRRPQRAKVIFPMRYRNQRQHNHFRPPPAATRTPPSEESGTSQSRPQLQSESTTAADGATLEPRHENESRTTRDPAGRDITGGGVVSTPVKITLMRITAALVVAAALPVRSRRRDERRRPDGLADRRYRGRVPVRRRVKVCIQLTHVQALDGGRQPHGRLQHPQGSPHRRSHHRARGRTVAATDRTAYLQARQRALAGGGSCPERRWTSRLAAAAPELEFTYAP